MRIWRVIIGVLCLTAIAGGTAFAMNTNMEKALEQNLPSVIGTILGGIIAGATFLFTILRDFTQKKISQQSSVESREAISKQYKKAAASVRRDLVLLTICLVSALALPIIRLHPVATQSIQLAENLKLSAQFFVTFFELFTLLISIAIILELIDTMFFALQEEI